MASLSMSLALGIFVTTYILMLLFQKIRPFFALAAA